MLFFTENGFLEVLSESQFENVFTLHATNAADFVQFTDHTPATVMFSPGSFYQYALWVRKEIVAEILGFIPVLFEVETSRVAVSTRVPLYLVEGKDPVAQTPVKLLLGAKEFMSMREQIDSLVDIAMYPIFSSPEAIMKRGGF